MAHSLVLNQLHGTMGLRWALAHVFVSRRLACLHAWPKHMQGRTHLGLSAR